MEAEFCSCDYEPFDWYDAKCVKARKEHRCCECSQPIKPGEVYERAVAKYDGRIYSYKTCTPCSRIRHDYCAPYKGLREQVWELLGIDIANEWTGHWMDDVQEEEESK
jgi:hypothetical protein